MDTLAWVDIALKGIVNSVVADAEKKILDIQYRMKRHMYGTEYDETAADVWARLKKCQDAEPWDMPGTFAALAELTARGQITDRI